MFFDKTMLESAILSWSKNNLEDDKYITANLKKFTLDDSNKIETLPEHIHPEILKSWIRSKKYGLDPSKHGIAKSLETDIFEQIYRQNKNLIQATISFKDNLSKISLNSNYNFVLTDNQGVILLVWPGNDMMAERAKQVNLKPGVICSEETLGTTPTGLCLRFKVPVQTAGEEHYCNLFRDRIGSSAPIFDCDKKLLGTVNIYTLISEERNLYIFGITRTIATSIENQIAMNKFFRNVLETMGKACLIINYNGLIFDVIGEAEKRLNISQENVVGLRYQEILGIQPVIEAVLEKGKDVQSAKILVPGSNRSFTISIKSVEINNDDSKRFSCLIFFNDDYDLNQPNKKGIQSSSFTFDSIIGVSPQIQKSLKIARNFSDTDINLLLIGESGVGKEVFAQAIHHNSREGKPFVAINCAAIPESLIESELFGYESGAFTGAERRGRAGNIELANEGTLFLDEIGDMPVELQAVLLRVIEEKKVMRLGSNRYIPVNFRLIAATNKNLKEMIALGKFREDLYYRLSVLKVSIPPLRDRREDIIALANYFLQKGAQRLNVPIPSISDAVKLQLLNYDWPGNVRQLESAFLYALKLCTNRVIIPSDLPEEITEVTANNSDCKKKNQKVINNKDITDDSKDNLSMKDMEKIIIDQTMTKCNNNVREAAKKLNISKSTLYRKLEVYNLDIL